MSCEEGKRSGSKHLCYDTLVLDEIGAAILLVALVLSSAAHIRLGKTDRRVAEMRQRLEEWEPRFSAIEQQCMALDARITRLQHAIREPGWRDSMNLTTFDWRRR